MRGEQLASRRDQSRRIEGEACLFCALPLVAWRCHDSRDEAHLGAERLQRLKVIRNGGHEALAFHQLLSVSKARSAQGPGELEEAAGQQNGVEWMPFRMLSQESEHLGDDRAALDVVFCGLC